MARVGSAGRGEGWMLDNGCTCADVRAMAAEKGDSMPAGWLCIACRAAEKRYAAGFTDALCRCGLRYWFRSGDRDPGDCGDHW